MKYTPPMGEADPNAPYRDEVPETGTEGSIVPAEAIEHPQREIVHVIAAAGLDPDDGDLTQLYQAIAALIAAAASAEPATEAPLAAAVAAVLGVSSKYAREDHVHPSAGFGDQVAPLPGASDCNAVTSNGAFAVPAGAANAPFTGSATMYVARRADGLVTQMALNNASGSARVAVRYSTAPLGASWSAWEVLGPSRADFTSGLTAYTNGSTVTIPHGRGVVPSRVEVGAVCATSEHSFPVNCEINVNTPFVVDGGSYGATWYADATNIYIRVAGSGLRAISSSSLAVLTAANWRFRARAWV